MVTKTTGQRTTGYIKNFVPCPECGEHWYILYAAKRTWGNEYKRMCRKCGHTARTDHDGNVIKAMRRPSVPCPDCGKPWRVWGVAGKGRRSHLCGHCGRKGLTNEAGEEVEARELYFSCPDCSAPLSKTRRTSTYGFYQCAACSNEFVRRYGANSPMVPLAQFSKRKTGPKREPRAEKVVSPEEQKRLADLKRERARVRKQAAEQKEATKKAEACPAKATIATMPTTPAMVKVRTVRRSVEDLMDARRLHGDDPLFSANM